MKDFLAISDLSTVELTDIVRLAGVIESESVLGNLDRLLRGKSAALAFFEDSTRTRVSFELAAKRLGMVTASFTSEGSSINKGESLRDTLITLEATEVDAIVMRHRSSGAAHLASKWLRTPVINAGDGTHEHPTQALLDCYTLTQKLGPLDGVSVLICGDLDQRVTRSLIGALNLLGASVSVTGPASMMPTGIENWGVTRVTSPDDVLGDIDVVYLVRIQKERKGKVLLPALSEYTHQYGMTQRRFEQLNPKALVMHPGPWNLGVEIDAAVSLDPRVIAAEQVSFGVYARMALLCYLLGDFQDNKLTVGSTTFAKEASE